MVEIGQQQWRAQRRVAVAGAVALAGGLSLALAQDAPQDSSSLPTGVAPAVAPVDATAQQFAAYLQLLAARARATGVSEATVATALDGLTLDPRVIAHDRAQATSGPAGQTAHQPAFAPYRRRHVDAARIRAGRAVYGASREALAAVEADYGVPGPIILAIWGHETFYGRVTGDYDLLRTLATLAFEGRRRSLFADEFIAALKMMDRGVPRRMMSGSWAGAFGNPQFLPSVYLRVAVDADHDGLADIWTDRADTLASIANYFRDAGWRAGEPWGFGVRVPDTLDRAALASPLVPTRCPQVYTHHSRWLTLDQWRARGVVPESGNWSAPGTMQAFLFEPDGPGRPAWLLTRNYRVILDYNCSNFYALGVGLLADAIAAGDTAALPAG